MLGLGSEEYPLYGNAPQVKQATDSDPRRLQCTVSQSYLIDVDKQVLESNGQSLKELVETHPRYAYVHLYHLFKDQFTDTRDEDWAIGSPEEDGEHAFSALTRYMEKTRPPDPDIEEIDVIISVWKRPSFYNRWFQGKKFLSEEVLQFQVGPEDLASC